METVDYGNPAYQEDKEHECSVCGKPIENEGVCSQKCLEIDMR